MPKHRGSSGGGGNGGYVFFFAACLVIGLFIAAWYYAQIKSGQP